MRTSKTKKVTPRHHPGNRIGSVGGNGFTVETNSMDSAVLEVVPGNAIRRRKISYFPRDLADEEAGVTALEVDSEPEPLAQDVPAKKKVVWRRDCNISYLGFDLDLTDLESGEKEGRLNNVASRLVDFASSDSFGAKLFGKLVTNPGAGGSGIDESKSDDWLPEEWRRSDADLKAWSELQKLVAALREFPANPTFIVLHFPATAA